MQRELSNLMKERRVTLLYRSVSVRDCYSMLLCALGRRYYNDLWLFDTEELRWEQVARPGVAPAPRGGCQVRT